MYVMYNEGRLFFCVSHRFVSQLWRVAMGSLEFALTFLDKALPLKSHGG